MVKNISVSPGESSKASAYEASQLQRCSSSRGSSMAQQQLVSSSPRVRDDSIESPSISVTPVERVEDPLRFILAEPPPTLVDFLRFAYRSQGLSIENVNFLVANHRASTNKQYQSIWANWLRFVHSDPPEAVTIDYMLSFFRFMFISQNKAVNTLFAHKSALKDPLSVGFDVDLLDPLFNKSFQAFALRRPADPPRPVSWSLDKVLNFLSEIDNETCSLYDLVGKSLFLIALASGGRVSEIGALCRGSDFSHIDPRGFFIAVPGRQFLAKNEDPLKRREPWKIPPLFGDNRSLCPVATIDTYLKRTADVVSGSLFRHESSSKPLTVSQVKGRLCSIIKKSNPDSLPRSHDVRKIATSYAFFANMSWQDISGITGWTSSTVFLNHYLQSVKSVREKCVILRHVTNSEQSSSLEHDPVTRK